MMRFLKIFFGIIGVTVVIGGIALFVFIRTFDINQYRAQLTGKISEALGRPVAVERLEVTFSMKSGVVLNIRGLKIEDEARFSKEPLIKVEQIRLNLDVAAFVQKREIVVRSVDVFSPRLNLVKNQEGQVNVQQIGQKSPVAQPAVAGVGPVPQPPAAASLPKTTVERSGPAVSAGANIPSLLVQSIRIVDGTVNYQDLAVPLNFSFKRLNLAVSDFSLNKPFNFSVSASVLSPADNVHIRGQVQLDLAALQATLADTSVSSDLSLLSFDQMRSVMPALKDVPWPDSLSGELELEVAEMAAGVDGLEALSAQARVSQGKIVLKQLPSPLSDINLKCALNEKDVTTMDFSARLGSGRISGEGRINDYLAAQKYKFDITTDGLTLGEVVPSFSPQVKLAGGVQAQYSLEGQNLANLAQLKSVSGQGDFKVVEGRLVDFNILKVVLDGMSQYIPGAAENLEANLPEKYREQLTRNDTIFKKAQVVNHLQEGWVVLDKIDFDTGALSMQGAGQVDLQQNLATKGFTFYVDPELSQAMVLAREEFKYLLGPDGRITVPLLDYQGPAAKFRPVPDPEFLLTNLAKSKLKEELLDKINAPPEVKELIGSFLGGGAKPPAAENTEASQAQPQPDGGEKSAEQELLNGLLEQFLKKD